MFSATLAFWNPPYQTLAKTSTSVAALWLPTPHLQNLSSFPSLMGTESLSLRNAPHSQSLSLNSVSSSLCAGPWWCPPYSLMPPEPFLCCAAKCLGPRPKIPPAWWVPLQLVTWTTTVGLLFFTGKAVEHDTSKASVRENLVRSLGCMILSTSLHCETSHIM